MNYDFQFNAFPQSTRSPGEIIENFKASRGWTSPQATGTDYFSRCEGRVSRSEANTDADTDGFDPGAIALNTKDKEINFKAVAPAAHSETAAKGVFHTSLGTKAAAASPGEPTIKSPAASPAHAKDTNVGVPLCSPNDEQKANLKRDEVSDDDQTTPPPLLIPATAPTPSPVPSVPHTPPEPGPVLFMPNIYRVRVDFFDNGKVERTNRYTAKLSITADVDDDPADDIQCFANFYSRSRDFKSYVERQGQWDNWYDEIWSVFEEACAQDLDFAIKPHVAILKQRRLHKGEWTITPILHTACILYQTNGDVPFIAMAYSQWAAAINLDVRFAKKKANAPFARGYYTDPTRADVEPVRGGGGMTAPNPCDFRRT